jgi:hypothetical protein
VSCLILVPRRRKSLPLEDLFLYLGHHDLV